VKLLTTLSLVAGLAAVTMTPAAAVDISGAGATFPYPIYAKWADAYKKETGTGLNSGLTRLKARFIIGPLSNGNVSLLTDMAKKAGLPWDMVFGSDLFGHYKPNAETYLGVCRLLDLEPDQVMMAAAHNYDLAAARKLGLMTAFFPRPQEYGPDQARDFRAEQEWEVVAADIEDMAGKLGV
jgi:2-haloacid dehalogenase